jgi:hydroxymethylpyrimidine kinase/phosphomethylpyrimidine kinase
MKPINPSVQTVHPILTIAGSDCSAGAGMQADLKTFQYFGLHGLTAVSCIVSETANIVLRIEPVDPSMLEDQIQLMLDSFALTVVKTGMLGSAKHVETVAAIFKDYPHIKLVIDPVMIASTGTRLIEPDAISAYCEKLLPLAYLITPNIPEAETLLGKSIFSVDEMSHAAKSLSEKYGCAVLLKGGHLDSTECTDLLFDGKTEYRFTSPRLDVQASHGTGCTLAAAVAANLANGQDLPSAVSAAKEYLNDCLKTSYRFVNQRGEVIHALNQGTSFS